MHKALCEPCNIPWEAVHRLRKRHLEFTHNKTNAARHYQPRGQIDIPEAKRVLTRQYGKRSAKMSYERSPSRRDGAVTEAVARVADSIGSLTARSSQVKCDPKIATTHAIASTSRATITRSSHARSGPTSTTALPPSSLADSGKGSSLATGARSSHTSSVSRCDCFKHRAARDRQSNTQSVFQTDNSAPPTNDLRESGTGSTSTANTHHTSVTHIEASSSVLSGSGAAPRLDTSTHSLDIRTGAARKDLSPINEVEDKLEDLFFKGP